MVSAAKPATERRQNAVRSPMAILQADYPGWRAWLSSAGRWWAVRLGSEPVQVPDGWAKTVDGDNEAKLRAALDAQERLPGGSKAGEAALPADHAAALGDASPSAWSAARLSGSSRAWPRTGIATRATGRPWCGVRGRAAVCGRTGACRRAPAVGSAG